MKHKEITFLLLMGFCCGSLLAFTYINPYNGQITLSELILQLSGSRGEFSLGFSSFPELLSFSSKLLQPFFLSCMLEQVYISIFVQQAFIFFQEHRIALHGMQKSVLSLHVLR